MHLVDLPDVTAEVVRRVIRQAPPGTAVSGPRHLRRPARPPGLIGRDHLESIMASLTGDTEPRTISPSMTLMVWNVVIWPAARTTTPRGSVDIATKGGRRSEPC